VGRGQERWRHYGGSGLVSWATQHSGPPPGLLDFYKVEQYLVQYLLLVLGKTSNRAKFYIMILFWYMLNKARKSGVVGAPRWNGVELEVRAESTRSFREALR